MNNLVDEIKNIKEVVSPEWAIFVKTGAHKERPPVDKEWWYTRVAAVLRKVNKYGPVGANRIAKEYGGRKNRGVRPERKCAGSRNIARKSLQQLESAGLIKQVSEPKFGKVVTKAGKELLNKYMI